MPTKFKKMIPTIQLEKLKKFKENGDIHASNLLTKIQDGQKGIKLEIIQKHVNAYFIYRSDLASSPSILDKVDVYNTFRKFAYKNNRDSLDKEIFTFQSKFLSTIMEEFFKLILQPIASEFSLQCGSSKAYSQLSIESNPGNEPVVTISTKDQDIALYNEVDITISGKTTKVSVPIVSIECKTWLDKTMLEGSASTGARIKQGISNAKFYIITETYGVGKSVQKPKSIDNIYIVKKRIHDNFDQNFNTDGHVVELIYNEIRAHIESINKSTEELTEEGINKGFI
jgi:hypothetical protein